MSLPLSRIMRARLSELGLSVDDLITRSDLAKSTIYSYLDDTRNPQGSSLRKLAAGLDWTAAELQARIDGTSLVSPVADKQIARIVELLPNIPKDRLDAIEQHVTLAVQPAQRVSTGRRDGASTRQKAADRKMREAQVENPEITNSGADIDRLWRPRARGFATAFAAIGRLIWVGERLSPLGA